MKAILFDRMSRRRLVIPIFRCPERTQHTRFSSNEHSEMHVGTEHMPTSTIYRARVKEFSHQKSRIL